MKTLLASAKRWFQSLLYVLTSFPVLVILFMITIFGIFSGAILPISVLLLLGLMTLMEYVAKSEIYRVNKILGTEHQIVPNWFSSPAFSWDGLKERFTSPRSWMAVAYVFIAFFWSIFAFVIGVVGIAGFLTILISVGLFAKGDFNRDFKFTDDSGVIQGNLNFESPIVRFTIGDGAESGTVQGSFQSWPVMVVGLVIFILSIWLIPRIARANARLVDGLLSGAYLPTLQAQFESHFSKKKVSEKQVRDAMQSDAIREELSELSNREREILTLMAQGKTNAGIAKILFITEGSVEKHISNILNKLGIDGGDDTHRRVVAVLRYLGINQ
jgi:DNA-binding CsgD family transcriptional regulator